MVPTKMQDYLSELREKIKQQSVENEELEQEIQQLQHDTVEIDTKIEKAKKLKQCYLDNANLTPLPIEKRPIRMDNVDNIKIYEKLRNENRRKAESSVEFFKSQLKKPDLNPLQRWRFELERYRLEHPSKGVLELDEICYGIQFNDQAPSCDLRTLKFLRFESETTFELPTHPSGAVLSFMTRKNGQVVHVRVVEYDSETYHVALDRSVGVLKALERRDFWKTYRSALDFIENCVWRSIE